MSDERAHLDFESRSTQPFGKGADAVSVNQYANHPETDLWCMSWAIGRDKPLLWDPWEGDEFPKDMIYALKEGVRFVAHNAPFEYAMWNGILVPRFGLPPLPIEQMDCTAARASIMALPRSLAEAAKAMGLKVEKDDAGRRLMMKMAKPRRAKKGEDPDSIWWHDSRENRVRLGEYCVTDTEVERALDDVIAPMTRYQREQWLRVFRANMRGVMVDTRFVEKAKKVMAVVERGYCDKMLEATDGAVPAVSALPAMKVWLADQGVDVASLDKTSIIHLLEDHKDNEKVVKVLTLRQEAGKSSVAKLDRFATLTNEQQRMLENFMFHAANTGRLGGKGAQLQNLPSRGGLKWNLAEQCIDIILATDDPEWACVQIELMFGEIPTVLSSCLRGCIIAPKGQKLFVADFSNIEGRVAAWLGNEQWKLKAFRLYDTPLLDAHGYPIPCKDDGFKRKGPDLYKVTAGEILGKSPSEIIKTERNVMGKVPELALGFGGGVGAFNSMAGIYNVDMAEYHDIVKASIAPKFYESAEWGWNKFGKASGTDMRAWLASETIKLAWRNKHPGLVKCWADAELSAIKALQSPGKWFTFADGKCAFGAKSYGGVMFLISRLPSGRRLYRANASLKMVTKFGKASWEVRFMGVDSTTRQWVRMSTYGGDLFQSFVQAIAYDLMDHGWKNVEEDGFEVVLSVHDELGAYAHWRRKLGEFEAGMNRLPGWAKGCPVSSAGYTANRYRKD